MRWNKLFDIGIPVDGVKFLYKWELGWAFIGVVMGCFINCWELKIIIII